MELRARQVPNVHLVWPVTHATRHRAITTFVSTLDLRTVASCALVRGALARQHEEAMNVAYVGRFFEHIVEA